jgi:hypothetical protein
VVGPWMLDLPLMQTVCPQQLNWVDGSPTLVIPETHDPK